MSLEERLPTTEKVDEMIEESSLASLYTGVLLGAIIGVIGNIFTEYLFSDLTTPANLSGVIASGIGFLMITWILWKQTKKYAKVR